MSKTKLAEGGILLFTAIIFFSAIISFSSGSNNIQSTIPSTISSTDEEIEQVQFSTMDELRERAKKICLRDNFNLFKNQK